MRSEYLDSITGIANRHFFDKQLHRAWANAQKTKNPLSLLLCEIDQLNSESGADSCLKKIAGCLEATLRRPTDVAAYYEGKKFALLLPYTDAHGTLIITHRILTNVRSRAIVCESSDPSESSKLQNTAQAVTISIGGHSFWPVPGVSLDTIIHLAEIRLFQAKNCGGNQSRLSTTCRDVLL